MYVHCGEYVCFMYEQCSVMCVYVCLCDFVFVLCDECVCYMYVCYEIVCSVYLCFVGVGGS